MLDVEVSKAVGTYKFLCSTKIHKSAYYKLPMYPFTRPALYLNLWPKIWKLAAVQANYFWGSIEFPGFNIHSFYQPEEGNQDIMCLLMFIYLYIFHLKATTITSWNKSLSGCCTSPWENDSDKLDVVFALQTATVLLLSLPLHNKAQPSWPTEISSLIC